MSTIIPANLHYKDKDGNDGDVRVLTEADVTLLQNCLDDVAQLKYFVGSVPVGSVLLYAGAETPAGFLVCNGAAVSRTDYARLFGKIGTLYGTGDGSTTFNVPDLSDLDPVEAGGTYTYIIKT